VFDRGSDVHPRCANAVSEGSMVRGDDAMTKTRAEVLQKVGLHRFGWRTALGVAAATIAVAVAGTASSVAGAAVGRVTDQAAADRSTVWLCRPGQPADPCTGNLTATSVTAAGATTVVPNMPATSSKYDCFYVYPTVSMQSGTNANLKVQPVEIAAAAEQAAQFSQVCNVWAPVYRQRTSGDLAKGLGSDPAADQIAYASLLSAWKEYLANDNDGRPVIFIGHSQGAAMLIRLLRNVIDPSATLRHQMVSAIILGGNVQVPKGKTVGGSFKNIPICTAAGQDGCVIAYSSFGSPPPATSLFGRPGKGVSLQSQQKRSAGQQVACVNPVTFGPGTGVLTPYFLTVTSKTPGVTVTTPWVTYPNLYTARCLSSGGATWLQIKVIPSPGDDRPTVGAALGPNWGLHLDDVNLALGNLVHDVALQEAAHH
jgi:Protein of unknown function (DUF3089)